MRARLGTAAHLCEVIVLQLRTVPIGTAPSLRILHPTPYTLRPVHQHGRVDRGGGRAPHSGLAR